MARPQNGVNGNVPQQYKFYLNSQIPRSSSQMYPYEIPQQVMAAPFPPVFPSMSHPVLTSQNSQPLVLPYTSNFIQPPFNPYSFPSQYSQFSYVNDVSTPTISNAPMPNTLQPAPQPPQTVRKFSPLTVVDPNSNTDVDLSKFNNQNRKSSLTQNQNLLKPDLEKPDKLSILNIDKVQTVTQIKESISEVKCEQSKENIEEVKMETLQVKSDSDVEQIAISSNSEDETAEQKVTTPDYNLIIDKKESDETTLKRKLTYDREYLIHLKSSIKPDRKPPNLPLTSDFSEDIILKEPNNITTERIQAVQDNNKYRNRNSQTQKQYSNNYKKNYRERKVVNIDIPETAPLPRSKSGFLPPHLRTKEIKVNHMHELKRNIKGNLNKITPQNFQECFGEISKLQIKEPEEMSCLINEIFVKAVKEEAYSVTYAQFCNKLATEFGNQAFKSELLKKCQDMFQTPLMEQLESVRTEWENKIEVETDSKIKTLYENDLEEQVKKAKDKYFGNIRFIGELFLHQLLAGKVILNCIMELLKGKFDADSMLALCKLLETCGKQIDMRHREYMNNFIREMNELTESKTLETRIKFKLRDIIDMRSRDWTLRHIQQEKKIRPKTFEEQKEEAAVEAANKAAVSQMQSVKKQQSQSMNIPNQRRNVTNNAQKPFQAKALSCAGTILDEKTVLGPTRNWTEGSGAKNQKHRDEGWTTSTNKSRNTNARLVTNSREQSPQLKMANRYKTLEANEASGPDSRSSTPPVTHQSNIKYPIKSKFNEPQISDDDRGEIIFKDLLTKNYFNDDSWSLINNVSQVVEKWIDTMMEKDETCRHSIGDHFYRLLSSNMLTQDQIINGAQSFVVSIEDLKYDIPKLWEFFSQFFERFIQDKNSNINFFQDIFKDILPNNEVAQCLSMSLHSASSRLGHHIVGHVFHKSQIQWEDILKESNDVEKFINKNSLEFTISGGAPLSPSGGYPLQAVAEQLNQMLENQETNEAVFDYLEKHLDKPTWKSMQCIRTITQCILKALKNIPNTNNREFLKEKKEIIKRVAHNKLENQLEILQCIMELASDLGKETLTIIYDVLSTDSIITNAAFKQYLQNDSYKSNSKFKLTESIISQLHVVENNNHR